MHLSASRHLTLAGFTLCLSLGAPALAATISLGEATMPVSLHGSAREVTEPGGDQSAIVLDGVPGSYAGVAVPESWKPVSFRVQVRFRLDEKRGGTVPLSWPGCFCVYVDGQGRLRVLLETQSGRMAGSYEQALPLGQDLEVSFEYRASDLCLLYVNGRSVMSLRGRGPLKRGGPELWLGRYQYRDEKTGQDQDAWMKGTVSQVRLSALPDDDRYQMDTTGLTNAINVSFGDAIVVGKGWRQLNRPEHAVELVRECQRRGVKKVFLRCDQEYILEFCDRRMPPDHWYMKALAQIQGDMHAEILRQCHAAGIKVYAYQTIFDCGSPTSVLYGGTSPFPWESRFTIEHPEYLMESRDGKQRQYGVLCYSYPQAREYMVGVLRHLMTKWAFDGLYLCTRTHSQPADFADQFGYNEPIVQEYRRRYGKDLRTEEFSRSEWYDLLGEGLTQLLRDVRQAIPGKEVLVAMPRSDTIGPPYGNMRLDWRRWCEEKLVDGLVVGVISGGWHYPNSMHRPGYIQSEQDEVAMRPLEQDLSESFGATCKASGVELYLSRTSIYSDVDRDLLKLPGMTGFMTYLEP